jgi:hypothetical protein
MPAAAAGPLDSLVRAQVGLSTRKVKFTGPVTLQIGGTGNVATSISKAKGPVASAPHASATATKAGPPLWVYGLIGGLALVLGAVGGFSLARRLPRWLPV